MSRTAQNLRLSFYSFKNGLNWHRIKKEKIAPHQTQQFSNKNVLNSSTVLSIEMNDECFHGSERITRIKKKINWTRLLGILKNKWAIGRRCNSRKKTPYSVSNRAHDFSEIMQNHDRLEVDFFLLFYHKSNSYSCYCNKLSDSIVQMDERQKQNAIGMHGKWSRLDTLQITAKTNKNYFAIEFPFETNNKQNLLHIELFQLENKSEQPICSCCSWCVVEWRQTTTTTMMVWWRTNIALIVHWAFKKRESTTKNITTYQ